MAYDTGLPVAVAYEAQVARWTRDLAETLPPGECAWSMGMPAYEDDVPWHRPDVETLAHGLAGLAAGLPDPPPADFTGAAIYASWTVDAAEWATWDETWRGTGPAGLPVPDPAEIQTLTPPAGPAAASPPSPGPGTTGRNPPAQPSAP